MNNTLQISQSAPIAYQYAVVGAASAAAAFYETASNSEIGAYATVEKVKAGIYKLPVAWENGMAAANADISAAQNQAALILQGLSAASNHQDSIAIYRAAESARNAALPAFMTLSSYLRQADSLRNIKATAAWVLNQALPSNDILQSNRKTANRVYLESIGHGIYKLSTSQFAAIAPIAFQCPLEGGLGVYLARELYALNEQGYFNDELLCGLEPQERYQMLKPTIGANSIKVQPNPVSGLLTISLPGVAKDNMLIQISDAHGRVLLSNELPSGANSLIFDVSFLPSGIYFCSAPGLLTTCIPTKFVVQH